MKLREKKFKSFEISCLFRFKLKNQNIFDLFVLLYTEQSTKIRKKKTLIYLISKKTTMADKKERPQLTKRSRFQMVAVDDDPDSDDEDKSGKSESSNSSPSNERKKTIKSSTPSDASKPTYKKFFLVNEGFVYFIILFLLFNYFYYFL
jgi:hypothetical protein